MRAFLALRIPDDIKAYLQGIIITMAKRIDGVKWVSENGQHVTLKFFGEIEEEQALKSREALAGIEKRHGPVSTALGQVEAFPNRKKARVVIVSLKKGIDNTRMIFNDIEDKLSMLGVEKENREFIPHITLGRRKVPAPLLEQQMAALEPKAFVLDTLILYRSTLTREGAIYDPIWEIKLGGKGT